MENGYMRRRISSAWCIFDDRLREKQGDYANLVRELQVGDEVSIFLSM